MLPEYEKLYRELTEAEKKGPKAVLNIYDRELERRKTDPAGLAELCRVIEEKAYEYYDECQPLQRDISSLYMGLFDSIWFRISFPDEKQMKQFDQAYADLHGKC